MTSNDSLSSGRSSEVVLLDRCDIGDRLLVRSGSDLRHELRPGIVSGQCSVEIPTEAVEQRAEILRTAEDVLAGIEGIGHPEGPGRARHQLEDALSAAAGDGGCLETGFAEGHGGKEI